MFTRGATEAINLVSNTWALENLKSGDEILLSVMEHHSNLVPWQIAAQKTGAKLQVCTAKDRHRRPMRLDDLKDIEDLEEGGVWL